MEWQSLIGYLAASLTTLSFLPQAIKVITTRNTQGISGLMYVMFVCGLVLWLIYGLLIEDTAVSMANFLTLLFALPILVIKYRRSVSALRPFSTADCASPLTRGPLLTHRAGRRTCPAGYPTGHPACQGSHPHLVPLPAPPTIRSVHTLR